MHSATATADQPVENTDPLPHAATDAAQDGLAIAKRWLWLLGTLAILLIGGANSTYPLPRGGAEIIGALMLAALLASDRSTFTRPGPVGWTIIAAHVALLLQFIPLPPALWTALPGREAIAELDTAVFGAPIWRPLTLDREATWEALLFALPAASIYLAMRTGDEGRKRAIAQGVAVAIAVAITMALVQTVGAEWAHPYADDRADNTFSNGFFTNHNHQATFLIMATLIVGAWYAGRDQRWGHKGDWTPIGFVDAALLVTSIIVAVCVLLAGSRAGYLLLAMALPAGIGAWLAPHVAKLRSLMVPALIAVIAAGGALLVLPFLGGGALGIVGDRAALASDRRFDVWPQALETAWQVFPFGTGFGTFRPAYELFEPLDAVGVLYVNHAHNEYIQLAIEGGIVALLLCVILLALIALMGWRAWRELDEQRATQGRLAFLALLVLSLHSLVDYPGRTISILVLGAIGLALLVQNAGRKQPYLASR